MFDTPQLKCFESDAQTINYRRQHGAVDGGGKGTGGKGEHTKCAVPEHHQHWLPNES